ncbi:MAG: LytTR family DNA-binding domain-containing protein [Balneolaceae bacterium]|nr:LytTR family DNA-binding domain-containing protein [Balneolaceae bacterium]
MWFCLFWIAIAGFDLGQDYISSAINENHFSLAESLSYKMFWLLFIPLSLAEITSLSNFQPDYSSIRNYLFTAILVTVFTLVHLLIFSLILYGISFLIHNNPWSLSFLISEKLSTRLATGSFIYLGIAVIHYLVSRNQFTQKIEAPEHLDKIPIKNGQKTHLIHPDQIKWISSDGAYLYIHTAEKKHVVLDSLKNIITTLPDNFKRIHRSTIVNIDTIKKLKSRGNGDYDVVLDSNHELRLSRNYTKPLRGLIL